jgi:HAD superfamily hydrolase (TIGR01490 family)
MIIAIFDFDGTISSKDSLMSFIQFAVGRPAFYLGLLKMSPMLATYTLRFISNHVAKEKLIAHFFSEWSSDLFCGIARRYSCEEIDKIMRPKALEKIRWHQDQGHEVVVVSASIDCWLEAWCTNHNITLICTQLEIKDYKVTGKFSTLNCHGIEKVRRLREVYDLSLYEKIYAYGDSFGDKELLRIADESFYKPFRS